jgi:hypothetical protein
MCMCDGLHCNRVQGRTCEMEAYIVGVKNCGFEGRFSADDSDQCSVYIFVLGRRCGRSREMDLI